MNGLIPFLMELFGTVAFAASGAMVGVGKKMDIFGVTVLGVITAVGGGMTRDVILGITPPNVFLNPTYVIVAAVCSCIIFGFVYFRSHLLEGQMRVIYDKVILVMDAVGLGIFTASGVMAGISHGYGSATFLLVFVGAITGVGGGLLRDVMAGVPPYIFVRHIYACASIVGAICCVYLYRCTLRTDVAMMVSATVVVLIRMLAAYYHWNLPKAELTEEQDD